MGVRRTPYTVHFTVNAVRQCIHCMMYAVRQCIHCTVYAVRQFIHCMYYNTHGASSVYSAAALASRLTVVVKLFELCRLVGE